MVEELKLYDFQVPVVDAVRRARRRKINGRKQNVLLQAPTGFGKTACFTYMVGRSYQRGRSVFIIAHLIELVDQIAERLERYGIPFSYIASGYPSGDEIIKVCSIGTLLNQLDYYAPPTWAIEDECHHAAANKWQTVREWASNTSFLGASATPRRLDNKPLNLSYDEMVCAQQRKELIALGQLVQPILYYPPNNLDFSSCRRSDNGELNLADQALELEKNKITGNAVDEYSRICPGEQFVVFAPTLEYSQEVADAFTAAGYPTKVISSKLNKYERRDMIKAYENKNLTGLVNVNLITEGVDIPGISCIIWLRHTESQVIWDQGNGRAMRAIFGSDKVCCWIIDHVGNCLNPDWGGPPDCDREYSLIHVPKPKKKKGTSTTTLKRCKACNAMQEGGTTCEQCGTVFETKEREIIQVAGQLVMAIGDDERLAMLMKKEALKKKVKDSMRYCKTEKDLMELAQELGIPDPPKWARAMQIRRVMAKKAVKV